jgi:hypothetical protein
MTYTVFSCNNSTTELELRPTHSGVFLTLEGATAELERVQDVFSKISSSLGDYIETYTILDIDAERAWKSFGVKFRTRH